MTFSRRSDIPAHPFSNSERMDYFKFTCPHCQTRIGTSPDTSGHTIDCPTCHGSVIIPPAPASEGEVAAGIKPDTAETPSDHEAAEHTMMLRKSDLEDSPVPTPVKAEIDPFDGPAVPDMNTLGDNPFGAESSTPASAAPATPDPFDEPKIPDMGSMSDGDNPFGGSTEEPKPATPPAPSPEPEQKEEPKPEEAADDPPPEDPKPEESKTEETPAESSEPAPSPDSDSEEDSPKKPEVKELIGNLTTEVKVSVVKQARTHIDDESKWIHGRSGPGGKVVLAAKKSGDTIVPLKPGSPDATHYSIVGSLLVAMDEINVKSTAAGRSEFLHYEIESATRKVTGQGPDAKVDPMNLGHKECLGVLEEMLKVYRQTLGDDDFADLLAGKTTNGESETTGLNELMRKPDDDLLIRDVIKVLNDEIRALKRRLDDLEK